MKKPVPSVDHSAVERGTLSSRGRALALPFALILAFAISVCVAPSAQMKSRTADGFDPRPSGGKVSSSSMAPTEATVAVVTPGFGSGMQSQTTTFYLHGTGPDDNPPTLFLNSTAPTAASAKFKDSPGINRAGGNPWKEVGHWSASATMTVGAFTSLSNLHVWLGLKNSDDQGTNFDLRVEAYKNTTLIASGQALCITGVTRNPSSAKEVTVTFDPFSGVAFNGTSDALALKVLTRVGTDAAGGSCGGHNNAVGLRVYFDAVSRPSRFDATVGSDATPPTLTVNEPIAGTITNATAITVAGTVADASPVTVTANGTSLTVSNGAFGGQVALSEGVNQIRVTATDSSGNQREVILTVTRDTIAPAIAIQQPAEGAGINSDQVTVTGTFSDATATSISINDEPAAISSNTFTAIVFLRDGVNTLLARAIDASGNRTEVSRTVYRIVPLTLSLFEPADGTVTNAAQVAISGMATGTTVQVTVNGSALTAGSGLFNSQTTLTEGMNTIRVATTDGFGNRSDIVRTVTADFTRPIISDLMPVQGAIINSTTISIQGRIIDATSVSVTVDNTDATVGGGGSFTIDNVSVAEGQNSIPITATDAAGNFTKVELLLTGKDSAPPPAPSVFPISSPTRLTLQTIEGRAEPGSSVVIAGGIEPVTATAEMGSGLFIANVNLATGSNALTVKAIDIAGNVSPSVSLSILSDPTLQLPPAGQPSQVNVSTGNTQRGLIATELPRPLIAIVTDKLGTPTPGVLVRFMLTNGGGHFIGGGDSFEIATDPQGYARARYVAGNLSGLQLIRADFPGNVSSLATFVAEAVEARIDGVTSVSGVVEDQNLRALPNVLVRIGGQQTHTGVDGRFLITNVPVGPHQILELIGRDQIALPGRWPNISYDIDVLPGVKNHLGRPLFLPRVNNGIEMPLDASNTVTRDTVYELPAVGGEPSIRVVAHAGTRVTFPPDVTDKRLSVTRIPVDKVPMALEDGRATNLYVSVQPSGAIFDPPLEVSFPNLDRLPSNSDVLLMSFDHDAGRYIRVGTGHVSADGRSVKSDPGSGIRIGAWHGFPANPPQPQTTLLAHTDSDVATCDCIAWAGAERAMATGSLFRVTAPALLGVAAVSAQCTNCTKVASVEFEQIDGVLDANPSENGGGRRVFPDATAPGGSPKKNVGVKIQVTPATANVDVYVKSFDVEDSGGVFTLSAHKGDDNQGFPKHGAFDPDGNTQFKSVAVKTDANGVARAQLLVSMKPGDNFKVAASLNKTLIDSVVIDRQKLKNPATGKQLAETRTSNTAGDEALATELLTVWRKAHIEADDMGLVTSANDLGGGMVLSKNSAKLTLDKALPDEANRFENGRIKLAAQTAEFELTGKATGLNAAGQPSSITLTVSGTLPNSVSITIPPQANALAADIMRSLAQNAQGQGLRLKQAGGRIVVGSINSQKPLTGVLNTTDAGLQVSRSNVFTRDDDVFEVKSNTVAQPNSVVELKSDGGRSKDSFGDKLNFDGFLYTSLVDDDDFNNNDAGHLKGDVGDDVIGLDLGLLQDSDDPNKNVFAPAFIRPVYDLPGTDTNVPFRPNMSTPSPSDGNDGNLRAAYKFSNVGSERDDNFWTVYLLGAYQEVSSGTFLSGPVGDGDPDSEKAPPSATGVGRTDNSATFAQGSAVFLESLRQGEVTITNIVCRAVVVAHEIGHVFGGDHPDGGLMSSPLSTASRKFDKKSLKSIRTLNGHP